MRLNAPTRVRKTSSSATHEVSGCSTVTHPFRMDRALLHRDITRPQEFAKKNNLLIGSYIRRRRKQEELSQAIINVFGSQRHAWRAAISGLRWSMEIHVGE